MRTDGNLGSTLSYYPNSFGEWQDHRQLHEPALALEGEAGHWDQSVVEDHFEQPGNLFRLMTPLQQQQLFNNTARAMGDAPVMIKHRHIVNCSKADPAYGAGVAKALGLNLVAQELQTTN
ncbi:Catalase [compost metagenome]